MKKFLAILLAAMMLCSVAAVAEEAVADVEATPAEDTLLNFEITMDDIPEGYEMNVYYDYGDVAYAVFSSDDLTAAVYYATVAPEDGAEGVNEIPAELSEDDIAEIKDAWCDGYNDPAISIKETSHGTRVICMEDNGSEGDQFELVAVWNGYLLSITCWKNGELDDADMERGMKILSDMWVVDAQ